MFGCLGDGIIHRMRARIGAILTMTTTTMDGICMKVTGIVKIMAIITTSITTIITTIIGNA
jgi:hypothetical protein